MEDAIDLPGRLPAELLPVLHGDALQVLGGRAQNRAGALPLLLVSCSSNFHLRSKFSSCVRPRAHTVPVVCYAAAAHTITRSATCWRRRQLTQSSA